MKLALIGGTGPQGKGLALRWAKAGITVVMGSRQLEKAETIANELNARLPAGAPRIEGLANADAARAADEFVVLTVPFSGHRPTLEGLRAPLAGKILVDVVVPLDEADAKKMKMPPEGSAVEEAEAILNPGGVETCRVVGALHNVSAHVLDRIDSPIHCDVLVVGRDLEAREKVIALCERLGAKAYNAGGADSARTVEGMTAVLIRLNASKKTPFQHAGIKIWAEA